jgi:hypothetical protein
MRLVCIPPGNDNFPGFDNPESRPGPVGCIASEAYGPVMAFFAIHNRQFRFVRSPEDRSRIGVVVGRPEGELAQPLFEQLVVLYLQPSCVPLEVLWRL